jgi:S1-C subfamily serine protease
MSSGRIPLVTLVLVVGIAPAQPMENQMARAASLGVQTKPGANGGLVATTVEASGSAASAGVAVGDELVAINGTATPSAEAVAACLKAAGGVGATATFRIIRGGATLELTGSLKCRQLSLDVEDVSAILERKISPATLVP